MEYRQIADSQYAYVAYPEKALLDLIYLRKRGDSAEFLHSLRLQNLEQINLLRLKQFADGFKKPKVDRAEGFIANLVKKQAPEHEMV